MAHQDLPRHRPAPPQPEPIDWAMVGILGVIWGGTFMVVRMALDGYGPITVACARTTLGALALGGLAVLLRRPRPAASARLWIYLKVIGVLTTALPFSLLSWGQQHVPSAFAGVTMTAVPLFVLPLAHFFSDEPLSMRRAIGVALGFCGTLVLVGPSLTQLGQSDAPLAQLACLGAAFSYSIGSVATRRCPPVDPLVMAAVTLAVGTVILIPAMFLIEGAPHWAGTRPGIAILALGLFPTALATLMRVSVVRRAGSVFMTLVNYQVPAWSMVFGAWILSEALPLRFFAALALILTGLAISQWFSLRKMLTSR